VSNDLFSVANKIIFISGASSGVGEHFAKMLSARGAKVVCAARRLDRLNDLVSSIQADGGQALAVAMDVTDRATIKAAFDAAEQTFGTPDAVICNAGATGTQPFLEMEQAVWDNVIDVNLNGVFHVGQEAAQRMVAAGKKGSIVNISSIIAVASFKGLTHYGASKAAINQLTAIMAHELAEHGIKVNALAPGYLMTDMVSDYYETEAGQADLQTLPLKRVGDLAELDGPVLLLLSDASSYMSGSVVTADACHSIRLG